MAAPLITDFGDENHEQGETGLSVTGQDFGSGLEGQGTLWMYANADRSGAEDQLTVGSHTNTTISGVEIPGATTNVAGTVYLAWKRFGDQAWSLPSYQFTLSSGVVVGPGAAASGSGNMLDMVRMMQ